MKVVKTGENCLLRFFVIIVYLDEELTFKSARLRPKYETVRCPPSKEGPESRFREELFDALMNTLKVDAPIIVKLSAVYVPNGEPDTIG